MSSRTVLSYLPDGLARRFERMERDIADLRRRSVPVINYAEPDEQVALAAGSRPQLLVMTTTGDSIAAGGDFVTFNSIVVQHGFAGVVAGSSWTHPVSGVYVLTYEHLWSTYSGGGTVDLYLDGVPAPGGRVASGSSGSGGRGTISYIADDGVVGQLLVTHGAGGAEACDATLWLALPDPAASTTSTGARLVTGAIPSQSFGSTDADFYEVTFSFAYTGGSVYLSNTSAGTGPIAVDDQLIMEVTHADSSASTFTHTFGTISSVTPAGPLDVTSHFEPGTNTVSVRLRNLYPTQVESTEIWLVNS